MYLGYPFIYFFTVLTTTEIINEKIIAKPFFGNSHGSIVVSIPKKIAAKCNLDTKSYVTIESNEGLITIKKLDLGELK